MLARLGNVLTPALCRCWFAVLPLGLIGCSGDLPPRPQWLVFVDTNAPVGQQLAAQPELSPDAAIDTIRIDIIDQDLAPGEFIATDPEDWPISFGIAGNAKDGVTLRIRGFPSIHSTLVEEGGVLVSQPLAEVTIDRVVKLEELSDEVTPVLVSLNADCIGTLPTFGSEPTTCVDAERLHVEPTEGITRLASTDVPSSSVGTWEAGIARDCIGPAPHDSVCIPGGYTRIGSPVAAQVSSATFIPALPYRSALLRPFFMDRTEVSVRRFRDVAASLDTPMPVLGSDDPACTFLGLTESANDGLPVNCVSPETARAFCEEVGGNLPGEAQWEHAARGRGQARTYAWGNEPPECCTTSFLRSFGGIGTAYCGAGLEEVGSHPGSPDCHPFGDVSRDGVLDLGGSMSELTRDAPARYDEPCWDHDGLPLDPMCDPDTSADPVTRGGNWGSGYIALIAAVRGALIDEPGIGFRCVYPAVVDE